MAAKKWSEIRRNLGPIGEAEVQRLKQAMWRDVLSYREAQQLSWWRRLLRRFR